MTPEQIERIRKALPPGMVHIDGIDVGKEVEALARAYEALQKRVAELEAELREVG